MDSLALPLARLIRPFHLPSLTIRRIPRSVATRSRTGQGHFLGSRSTWSFLGRVPLTPIPAHCQDQPRHSEWRSIQAAHAAVNAHLRPPRRCSHPRQRSSGSSRHRRDYSKRTQVPVDTVDNPWFLGVRSASAKARLVDRGRSAYALGVPLPATDRHQGQAHPTALPLSVLLSTHLCQCCLMHPRCARPLLQRNRHPQFPQEGRLLRLFPSTLPHIFHTCGFPCG